MGGMEKCKYVTARTNFTSNEFCLECSCTYIASRYVFFKLFDMVSLRNVMRMFD